MASYAVEGESMALATTSVIKVTVKLWSTIERLHTRSGTGQRHHPPPSVAFLFLQPVFNT